jgi:uncharacterized spore protein YtfJ
MTDDATRAAYDDAGSMASKVPGLLEGLADRLGASAGAKAVFGEAVEKDGRTIVPVAQSIIGTGAGGGGGAEETEGSGLGAGGGAMTKPIGYIEITGGSARFVPLQQPWQDPKLILAYALLVLITARAINRILRG